MKQMIPFFLTMVLLFTNALPSQEQKTADLVIMNGKVITVDDHFSLAEAVAVKKDRILEVGNTGEIERLIGPDTRIIRLKGETVLPGLTDAHAHLNSLGAQLVRFNITSLNSLEEIVEKVQAKVTTLKPGQWIIGGRWDQTQWPEKKFPVHDALSAVSPDNPVYLRRVDGNSAFVNQKAMEIAGINRDTPEVAGGAILRKANGEPTGVLVNRAMNLVKKHFPEETRAEAKTKILLAIEDCVKKGLTGIHEAGISPEEIDIYKELVDEGKLKLRVHAMLGEQEHPELDGDLEEYFKKHRLEKYGNHLFSVRSIKLFFDGALGSRGAAFYEPYADDPVNRGLLRISPEYITRVARAALRADMAVCTHCIGIRGNRLCLEAYEKALKNNPRRDHRFRIEHAQVVSARDIPLFKKLGVIPSMQPTHCTSDMRFIEKRIGRERCSHSYAWRSFIDSGSIVPCGSDFPVESNNPFLGIYAAVTRQDRNGQPGGGWFPEQRMTREEAIRGFTIWAAFASFQEKRLGSIEPGKLADFTVIDRDILTVPPKGILHTKVLYTIVNGKVVFQHHP